MLLFCSCQFLTSDFSFCTPGEILLSLKNDANIMFSLSFPFVLPWADLPTQLLRRGPDLRAVLGTPNVSSLVTKEAPSGHSHLKQQSTSYQKILCFNKAFSRINHTMVRWGGGAEHPWAWVYRTPHQLCTSPLFCSMLREPLDFVSVGEGGRDHWLHFCPCAEKDAMSENHSSKLHRSVSPHVTDEAQRASAAHLPRVSVGWGRARIWTQARGPTCFAQLSMLPYHDCWVTTTLHDHPFIAPHYCRVTIPHWPYPPGFPINKPICPWSQGGRQGPFT